MKITDLPTTVAGYLLALLYALQDVLQNGAVLSDWKTWIVPVLIAVIGHCVKTIEIKKP